MTSWKRIGLAVKSTEASQPGTDAVLRRIHARLEAHGVELLTEARAAENVPDLGLPSGLSRADVAAKAELMIVLGGDGTVLSVVREIGERGLPVLGINLGHLGFLTDVRPEDVEHVLDAMLRGEHRIQERSRLRVECVRDGVRISSAKVLNDAVITKGTALARMIDLDARADGSLIARYRSDGLIVASPTGSTAYNLSAGGPLLDPSLPAMILTPICPHTLTQRPFVLPDHLVVEVHLLEHGDVTLTLDGQVGTALQAGDRIRVTRAAHPARFLAVPSYDHFETLRTKLRWGQQ
jgi:NAD+ kinase